MGVSKMELDNLVKQAKSICEKFDCFELVGDEYIPMCLFNNPMNKDDNLMQVCVRGNDACMAYNTFDTRVKSIERLAKIATKLHNANEVKQ